MIVPLPENMPPADRSEYASRTAARQVRRVVGRKRLPRQTVRTRAEASRPRCRSPLPATPYRPGLVRSAEAPRSPLESCRCRQLALRDDWSLTMHLARAGALENAGICLHPVYGFAYLPGSGLKGMARAYASIIEKAADPEILTVFGNEPGEPKSDRQRAGSIVFHDAWPLTWPALIEDIVNNHHRAYYAADERDQTSAPGDWEEPSMVSFLAVGAGIAFDFPLAKRRGDVPDSTLEKARRWLIGGLTLLGAGAKTAAGYGAFRVVNDQAIPETASVRLQSFRTMLELVTPAFLAGPSQTVADCNLRPATLRGLLRWWWRTLHAGFVDVATLRRLESAVWGSTKQGGAIRLTVEPLSTIVPLPYDKRYITQRNQLPSPPNNKTTQGLSYHSYGMDEQAKGRRFFVPPGTTWRTPAHRARFAFSSTGLGNRDRFGSNIAGRADT